MSKSIFFLQCLLCCLDWHLLIFHNFSAVAMFAVPSVSETVSIDPQWGQLVNSLAVTLLCREEEEITPPHMQT